MATKLVYVRFSSITVTDPNWMLISGLQLGDASVTEIAPTSINSTVTPYAGTLSDLILVPFTNAVRWAKSALPVITITYTILTTEGASKFKNVRQGRWDSAPMQISSCLIEYSEDGASWSTLYGGSIAIGTVDTSAAPWTSFATNYYDISEVGLIVTTPVVGLILSRVEAAAFTEDLNSNVNHWFTVSVDETALAVADILTSQIIHWFNESIASSDLAVPKTISNTSISDLVYGAELLRACFNQLVLESANITPSWYLGIAPSLIELAVATGVADTRLAATQALAETIVTIELLSRGQLQSISESAAASDVIGAQVDAVKVILEQALAVSSTTTYLLMTAALNESVTAMDTSSLWQNLTVSINEGASAFIHLSIGGEVFTGWVTNTMNMASTEYQGLAFNSLCKIGTKYFGAMDDGIYQLTGKSEGAFYIEGGLLDFGTSFKKRVTNAFLAVDLSGRLAIGVGVSEKAGVDTEWYEVEVDSEAMKNIKIPIGKGLQGRYWKFSVAGESLKSFEAVTLLPFVMSRRT